ncbi:hypothetical protein POX_b01977 [Penicillium oxalicum]|uniref:hypothetical protein n=1 Tax=Penicillium oxalicum TaxID=69781 RepID=UPI0020B8772F|nr:hypothetical protein POX_b01977 [Penicillium oxalicum]KAI2791948.1 hypothetical protein POX_b01977 [Penicillium oxalicum]
MKVTLKEWNAVATWHWDMPEDEVCGISRVQFDGTCPTCKFPGDECALSLPDDMDSSRFVKGIVPNVPSK